MIIIFRFVLTSPLVYGNPKGMPRLNKETAQERALRLHKAIQKAGGSQSKAAKQLGVTRGAIHQRIKKNPEYHAIRKLAIAKAAASAGLTLHRIYSVVNKSLDANVVACFNGEATESDAPDHRARLIGAKIGLELFEHLGADTKDDGKIGNELADFIKNSDTSKLKGILCLLK